MMLPLEAAFFDRILLPGDVLVYRRNSFMGKLIQIKTYGKASHVESYIGELKTAASRDGLGVNTYDFTSDGLVAVLRPTKFDAIAALAWHKTVIGQKYDWLGLFWSFYAVHFGRLNNKMFCSEHTTRYQRAGGFEPFSDCTDADAVSPADFLRTPVYTWIWRAPGYGFLSASSTAPGG